MRANSKSNAFSDLNSGANRCRVGVLNCGNSHSRLSTGLACFLGVLPQCFFAGGSQIPAFGFSLVLFCSFVRLFCLKAGAFLAFLLRWRFFAEVSCSGSKKSVLSASLRSLKCS